MLLTGIPLTCASRQGLCDTSRAPRTTIVRARNACCPIVRLQTGFRGEAAPEGTPRLRAKSNRYKNARPQADGRHAASGRLFHVGQAEAHTFEVAEATTYPRRPVLAEAEIHPETQREPHV